MEPELVVPDHVHSAVVAAREPPVPVGAFGDHDLAPRARKLGVAVRMLAGVAVEPVARLGKQVPGDGVLRIADPGVEAGVDPAAGVKPRQRYARLVTREVV